MTVSYSIDVSKSSLITFIHLQCRWRGSIWKSVFLEVVMFCFAFIFLSIIYNYYLNEDTKKFWDDIAALFDSKMDYIPLTFMLGFFVTIIVNRWNEIFNSVGWIDPCALVMATYLRGSDEKSRMLRRNSIRYIVLTQVLVFRDISMQVRKRFPSLDTIVASGIMTEEEKAEYDQCTLKSIYPKYFLPIQWVFNILYEARVSGKIAADLQLNEIMKCVLDFRKGLAQLCNFDWVPIPLVYPQVVFLAVRSYFFLALIARQSVLIDGSPPNPNHPIFPLVPFIMTALQFIFYVGWMKVAESLMNPLGEDDDDFECNFLIDRNLQLGFTIVDDTYNNLPPQHKDAFWSEKFVEPLYSSDTANKPMCPQIGSAAQYEPNIDEILMVPHESNEPEMELDGDEDRLLPRVVSVVSVNRETGGSRMSLNSRKATKKGLLGSLTKKFTRENRVSRPSRLGMRNGESLSSLTTPTVEYAGSSFDLVDEGERGQSQTPDTSLNRDSVPSPRRLSPSPLGDGGPLMSVPEEDEEVQRTRNSIDLRNLMAEAKKCVNNPNDSNTKF